MYRIGERDILRGGIYIMQKRRGGVLLEETRDGKQDRKNKDRK